MSIRHPQVELGAAQWLGVYPRRRESANTDSGRKPCHTVEKSTTINLAAKLPLGAGRGVAHSHLHGVVDLICGEEYHCLVPGKRSR